MSEGFAISLRKQRYVKSPSLYRFCGLKIFTPLSLRFQDFQRLLIKKTSMAIQKVKNYCSACRQDTNHDAVAEHQKSYRKEYTCDFLYQVVTCRGCENIFFRKVFVDIEHAFPIGNDKWDVPEDIDVFPKVLKGHVDISESQHIPNVVGLIYTEVISAIRENAKILAGLGLRGIVEVVCNDLNISGRSLEIQINKLVATGNISKNDAELLHAIRFLATMRLMKLKARTTVP